MLHLARREIIRRYARYRVSYGPLLSHRAQMDEPEARAASARAHSNIALIKYWGKRDAALNLPAVGSISITLEALSTDTRVVFDDRCEHDTVQIDGAAVAPGRFTRFLDRIRASAGIAARARVASHNNFPGAAGLASSASGFAALALAATHAAGLKLDARDLSLLARYGSGSAARSIFGGFVEMQRGENNAGDDAYAKPLLDADAWPLAVVIAITATTPKPIDSSAGMTSTAAASDYYRAWVEHAPDDLAAMRAAIEARDFAAVGELSESSCLKMHALMLSTRPGLIYWNAATLAAMHAVRALRADGVPVYFTIDAGPQLKALCPTAHAGAVADALARVPGVLETRRSGLGGPAVLRGHTA